MPCDNLVDDLELPDISQPSLGHVIVACIKIVLPMGRRCPEII
jgi:hypothetical protein